MAEQSTYSTTALKRWSCQDSQLPPVDQIRHIHIYDFDNTLFSSPMPNKQIWTGTTCGLLQASTCFQDGGWWHNPEILAATGQGEKVERTRAWKGFWNENIADLVQLSSQDPSTLTVLLTGRSEKGYKDLLARMISSKALSFDILALKPEVSPTGKLFSSTLAFKEAFIRELVATYALASELRIYEDRPKHVKSFTDFFENLNSALAVNKSGARPPIQAEVIEVSEQEINMDPVAEVETIQRMINRHNQAVRNGTAAPNSAPFKIKRSVFYTGYMVKDSDSEKLRSYVQLPADCEEHEMRYLANNVLIAPRPAPKSILNKVGGIGAKVRWRATGLGVYEDRVWALRVTPIVPGTIIHTENATPSVVLALRQQAKPVEASYIQHWQPIPAEHAFEFDTTVGEKVLLRIDEEHENEDQHESQFAPARNGRKLFHDQDFPALGADAQSRSDRRPYRGAGRAGRGTWTERGGKFAGSNRGGSGGGGGGLSGRGGHRGNGNFAPSRGSQRGRGNRRGAQRGAYRSLDDNSGATAYNNGGMQY